MMETRKMNQKNLSSIFINRIKKRKNFKILSLTEIYDIYIFKIYFDLYLNFKLKKYIYQHIYSKII